MGHAGGEGSNGGDARSVGELEFQVWHEKCGYLVVDGWVRGRFTVSINAGAANKLGEVKVPPALFDK